MGVIDIAPSCGSEPVVDGVRTAVFDSNRTCRVLDAGSGRQGRIFQCMLCRRDSIKSLSEQEVDDSLHAHHLCHTTLEADLLTSWHIATCLWRFVACGLWTCAAFEAAGCDINPSCPLCGEFIDCPTSLKRGARSQGAKLADAAFTAGGHSLPYSRGMLARPKLWS